MNYIWCLLFHKWDYYRDQPTVATKSADGHPPWFSFCLRCKEWRCCNQGKKGHFISSNALEADVTAKYESQR